jgi:hypothetical protein
MAEEVLKQGKWVVNENLEFDFKHELGHAVNAKFSPFGEPISETGEFRQAFRSDMQNIDPKKLDELLIPTDTIYATRDEVFADLYAHSKGALSSNSRSNQIRDMFQKCLKYVKEGRPDLP